MSGMAAVLDDEQDHRRRRLDNCRYADERAASLHAHGVDQEVGSQRGLASFVGAVAKQRYWCWPEQPKHCWKSRRAFP